MLIITGTYKAKSGKREEFLRAILDQGIYDEFLKEEGNISYDYYFPYGNDDDVFIFERWESRDAWEAHKVAPHTARLQDIKNEYLTGFVPGVVGEIIAEG